MKQLLLLHGALGSKDQLMPLRDALEEFDVHLLNFYGHGGEPGDKPFSLQGFADQVLRYIQDNKLDRPDIFGYSMGGYVALLLAKSHPEKVNKVITLATKFSWDEATAENEVKFLDPKKIESKIPAYADELQKRHSPADWKDVLQKTKNMMENLGLHNPLQLNDYSSISTHVLLLMGDTDKMISFDETIAVYKHLQHAEFCVLPATPHPIEQMDLRLLSFHIRNFLEK